MTERRTVRLTVADHLERQAAHARAFHKRVGRGIVPSDRVHRAAIAQIEQAEAERAARAEQAGDETFTRDDLDVGSTAHLSIEEQRIRGWATCAPGMEPFAGGDFDPRVSRQEARAIQARVDPIHGRDRHGNPRRTN